MNRQNINTLKGENYSNQTITYMKAIAIMLMVLGHSFYNTYVESWVNMFHVPVFFFTAGYCFKESHLDNFKLFITNLKNTIKYLDNAKVKGLIHQNKVNREKSRLTKKVNAMEVK